MPAEEGAAARVWDQADVRISAAEPSEIILVDVPLEWTPVGVWGGRETSGGWRRGAPPPTSVSG